MSTFIVIFERSNLFLSSFTVYYLLYRLFGVYPFDGFTEEVNALDVASFDYRLVFNTELTIFKDVGTSSIG